MSLTIRKVCDAEYKAASRPPRPPVKPGDGSRFVTHCPRCGAPTSVADEAYCANSDCRWNNDDDAPVRPSASQESAPRPLRAPRAVKAQGATRNAAQWQQIALHLTDRVVNP